MKQIKRKKQQCAHCDTLFLKNLNYVVSTLLVRQAAGPRVLQSLALQALRLRMLKDAANRSTPIMGKLAREEEGVGVGSS